MGSPLRLSSTDLSAKYDLKLNAIDEAFHNFDSHQALLLGFSGKIGAGKDSVAPLTFDALELPGAQVRTDSFSANLKNELNSVIDIIRASDGISDSVKEISNQHGVTRAEAASVVQLIYTEIETGELLKAADRTLGSRLALQRWATEIRRFHDPLYWVKPVIQRTISAAAEGVSTQITDERFLTEAWGSLDAGGWLVRLDVTPEEQARRIMARDGIEVTETARNHVSETELDNFQHFSVRIQTDDYSSAESVARAAARGVNMVTATLF